MLFANTGVDIFFVLSGFIITWVFFDDLGRPVRIPRYLAKRLLRIYPAYLALALLLLALSHLGMFFGSLRDLGSSAVLKELLLLPGPDRHIVPVSWSLTYELYFYLVFALIMLFKPKWFPLLTILWGLAIALLQIPQLAELTSYVMRDDLGIEFIAGCLIAFALKKGLKLQGRLFLCISLALLVAGGWVNANQAMRLDNHDLGRVLVFGGSAVALVLAACLYELRGHRLAQPLVQLAGDASYSLYLGHLTGYAIVRRLTGAIDVPFPAQASLALQLGWDLLMLGAGLAAGLAVYWLIERPLLLVSARLLATRPPVAAHRAGRPS